MVEGAGIPNSPNHLNQLRTRAGRVEARVSSEKTERPSVEEADDRFEPSSELAAQEAGGNQTVNLNTEQNGGGAGQENEAPPIQSADEASRVVGQTREQISFNATGAAVAQGNLDQENVLNLIA